jgi:hypothetical protein
MGRALLEFFSWEVASGRVRDGGGSHWWSAVNEALVLDLWEAGRSLSEEAVPETAEARAWVDYARSGPDEAQRLLWLAHQRSIETAVAASGGLRIGEPPAEQRLIDIVLEVLDQTARAGRPTDTGGLGAAVRQTYPGIYPAESADVVAVLAALAADHDRTRQAPGPSPGSGQAAR